jgi:hypothetical protein
MAIKGKGKTRGGRAVAPAPRPVVVTRKPPIWKRRWVIVTTMTVLIAAGVILTLSLLHGASVRHFNAKQKSAVGAYSDRIVATLPSDIQSVGGDTVFLFPNVATQLDDLASGKTKPEDSLALAEAYSKEAAKAVAAMQAVKMGSMIPADLNASQSSLRARGLARVTLAHAQFLMLQGLRTYERAFTLWQTAAAPDTPDALRKPLANEAKTLTSDASRLFEQGWTIFVQVRHQAGLPQLPQFSQPPAGTTPGSTTPSPLPTATASPSESSSASPSASP